MRYTRQTKTSLVQTSQPAAPLRTSRPGGVPRYKNPKAIVPPPSDTTSDGSSEEK